MTIIKCAIDGCASQFTTAEDVAVDVRFICKNHTTQIEEDVASKFQREQFQVDIGRPVEPMLDKYTGELSPDKRRVYPVFEGR